MASLVRVYNSKNIANGSHAKYTLNWDSVESFKFFARSTPCILFLYTQNPKRVNHVQYRGRTIDDIRVMLLEAKTNCQSGAISILQSKQHMKHDWAVSKRKN